MRAALWLPALLVGAAAGLAGESLLLLRGQARGLESFLREDFRILLFQRAAVSEPKQKVLEEKLRSMRGVADVRFVSPAQALAALRREEPELVESVLLVGENPLQPAFEVKLEDEAIAGAGAWIEQVQALADWADIRYKPAQVQGVIHAAFYGHLIEIVLSALVCVAGALGLHALWAARRSPPGRGAAGAVLRAGASGAIGAVLGALAVAGLSLPLRPLTAWWFWPPVEAQALLAACAAVLAAATCSASD